MPVEPVELEACRQERRVTSPSFYYFTLLFFYIGACNSPDKLLTIYTTNNPKNSYRSFTFYTQSQKLFKFRPKKSSCIFISTSSWVRGAGGAGGREGGSRVVEGVGMEESAFPGPQMFNEDRYVVSLSRSILMDYAIQPGWVSL